MSHFAQIAAPLNDLLGVDKGPFRWEPMHEHAFRALKSALVSPPVLVLPDWSKPFVVTADASDISTGAVLTQEGKAVAFMSAKLSPAERNYTADERETLAVVTALTEWRQYLFLPFTLETDSQVVAHLLTKRGDLTQRQQRWVERMTDFQFTVTQVKSKDNVADPLSRRPVSTTLQGDDLPRPALFTIASGTTVTWEPSVMADVAAGYTVDPGAMKIISRISTVPDAAVGSEYRWVNGLLLVGAKGDANANERVYVPESADLRVRILSSLHDGPMAGHPGRDRMLELAQRSVYWPGLAKDIKRFVTSCDACQRAKSLNRQAAAPLHPLDNPVQR